MPSSRPNLNDLLAVVREYLERDLAPLVPEYHRFQLRIVDRLLATIDRETRLGPMANDADVARLAALLHEGSPGATGGAPSSAQHGVPSSEPDGAPNSLAEHNRQLAQALRDGQLRHDDPRVLAHLRATLEDSLRINNPKWLATSGVSAPRTGTGTPQSS